MSQKMETTNDLIKNLSKQRLKILLNKAVETIWNDRWDGTECSEDKETEKWEILNEIMSE